MESPAPASGRTIIVLVDGTLGDSSLLGSTTYIGELNDDLLPNDGRQQPTRYVEGLGTTVTVVDYILGASTGLGIHRQIRRALRNLVKEWSLGDKVIIVGYSRGAYAAILLAELISIVGLPRKANSVNALYKLFKDGKLADDSSCTVTASKYKCDDTITIEALALFDAVSTLGIPKTGVLRPLDWLPGASPPINSLRKVKNVFHALAIHETRAPYRPALVFLPPESGTNLQQVWFSGTHRDLGKKGRGDCRLGDIPFVWMIDKLQSLGVRFDEEALKERFPNYCPHDVVPIDGVLPLRQDLELWAAGPTRNTYRGLMTALGYEVRRPGRYTKDGAITNERIHVSVRFRNHGVSPYSPVLPSMRYVSAGGDAAEWASTGSWWSEESARNRVQVHLDEAVLGAFEARLQNLPLE